jgi:hypothetical protein
MKTIVLILILSPLCAIAQDTTKTDYVYHSLEGSYIALNAIDVMLTYKGIEKGAIELNPLLSKIINNKPLFIGIKATLTFGVLWYIRRLKKDNNKLGYGLLIAANVLYCAVVANNYSVKNLIVYLIIV